MGDEDTTDMAVTDLDTDMDSVISARGPLMPNPRLMLMPLLMLTTDTTAVDTDTDMVLVMAVTTDMVDTPMPDTDMDSVISARGPLMPNLRLMPLLMLTTDTTAVDTDTDTDTVMAVTTVMVDTVLDTDMVDTAVTTVRFNRILACRSKNLFHNHIHPATNNNF